jgi:subtilisin
MTSKRNRILADAISAARTDKSELELIIGTDTHRRDDVARQLERIGKLQYFYDFVPYVSLVCDADYADILRKASSGKLSDSIFDKNFRNIVSMIESVELSNELTIPEPSSVVKSSEAMTGLWGLEVIGAYKARQFGNGSGVSVAVIDSGVDYTHPLLKNRFGSVKGYDFVEGNKEPFDKNGHGTHVAGTIASDDFGIAPGCNLYAVRALDENGAGNEADAIAGIEWCVRNKIDVANMSFGSPMASFAMREVCDYAWQQGMILVAAAGNDGYGPNYPAAFGDSVIAVAAVDENLRHPEFSNVWETNDISAPGVNIASTYPGNKYSMMTGTSMASPHVAGSLALALSVSSSQNLESVMADTADELGDHDTFGSGLIRVDKMVQYLPGSEYVGRSFWKGFVNEVLREARR